MKFGRLLAGVAAFGLLSGSASAAGLYSQAPTSSAFFASQYDTNTSSLFATAYDNFALGSSASISSINFTGEYDNDPAPPPFLTGFTLSIYSDSLGQPGGLLYTQIVSSNANETLVAGQTYTYGINFTSSFAAAGGTTYWVSVVSDLDQKSGNVWGWSSGTGGDGSSYQDVTGLPRTHQFYDLAFTLNGDVTGDGTSVPEPISISIFGAGLAGAIAMRRRKKTA
jgi:hypothetical protein